MDLGSSNRHLGKMTVTVAETSGRTAITLVRSAAFYGAFTVVAGLAALIVLVGYRKSALTRRLAFSRRWARVNRGLLAGICGLRARFVGLENLPRPPFVILSNHQSSWETIVFPAFLPDFVWVLKESLLKVPLFGHAIASLGPIGIDRGTRQGALRKVLQDGSARLEQGICVLVFPEGTRFAPGTAGRYQSSGAVLALSSGVPVVPIAHNAGQFWRAYGFPISAGTVEVRIGRPIETSGRGAHAARAVGDEARKAIETMMAEITGPRDRAPLRHRRHHNGLRIAANPLVGLAGKDHAKPVDGIN
jgi:1-acyl-sn-glycerol-3-phosphate acyltransferase